MAAVSLKKADRVPVVPQITYATASLTGIHFSDALRSPEKMADAIIAGYREAGYDGVYVGWESSFNLLAEAMGCELKISPDIVASVKKPAITTEKDVEKVPIPDPERDGRLPVHLKALDLVKEELPPEVPIFRYIPGALTLSNQLRGTENFLRDLLRNPDLIEKVLELSEEASLRFGEATAEHGADVLVLADPMASSTVISPEMFEKYAYPSLKRTIEAFKKLGVIASLHICGNTLPILERMVDTGAQILELDHLVDLEAAKRRVGRRVCIMGNVNPTGVLLSGSPQSVEEESRRCIEKAAEDGGFILSSGCEVPLRAPFENVKAMVQASIKYGRYS